MATEPVNNVTVRQIDLNAEIRKIWGPEWNKPTVEYEFSNGRKFERRTEEAAIYQPQS
jgi:hypothetical protein